MTILLILIEATSAKVNSVSRSGKVNTVNVNDL